MAELVTLEEIKRRHDITDTAWDEVIIDWIEAASDAAQQYCGGRQFEKATAATSRVFPVAGGAELLEVPVDDLAAAPTLVELRNEYGDLIRTVTAETVTVPRNLIAGDWRPITALAFRPSVTLRPEWELHVTGTWGFPLVPPQVREAVAETVREWLRGTQAVTNEAPALTEPGFPQARGLPLKARMLLEPLTDWTVPA